MAKKSTNKVLHLSFIKRGVGGCYFISRGSWQSPNQHFLLLHFHHLLVGTHFLLCPHGKALSLTIKSFNTLEIFAAKGPWRAWHCRNSVVARFIVTSARTICKGT
ncbi:Uncharacterized protein TCM_043138 [Theobroma cacao]|uniref:Uncharacterized protein n=1 Tax=Theobroma cacao TaxID=3641 RepID=A0A061FP30_THECC|nr:Uncharacterized protein TCM_043138 [Theobroma cacao]